MARCLFLYSVRSACSRYGAMRPLGVRPFLKTSWFHSCCVCLLAASVWLRGEGAFEEALEEMSGRTPLQTVLRETLHVHSSFLAMLIARDLAVLLPKHVSQADVDACTVVGAGADAALVGSTEGRADGAYDKKGKWHYSTGCRATFDDRLRRLHKSLLDLLDPALLQIVVPQGWTLDLTENACCELRRWDNARTHRRRGSQAAKEERQQARLEELRVTWQLMGFEEPPQLVTG